MKAEVTIDARAGRVYYRYRLPWSHATTPVMLSSEEAREHAASLLIAADEAENPSPPEEQDLQ